MKKLMVTGVVLLKSEGKWKSLPWKVAFWQKISGDPHDLEWKIQGLLVFFVADKCPWHLARRDFEWL